MQYSKLILAFVIVLAIVVLAGSMRCDGYADINDPLTLSSDFRRKGTGTTTSAQSKEEAAAKERERTEGVVNSLEEKSKSLRQDRVSLFTEINYGGRKVELDDVPFDESRAEGASKKIGSQGILEYNNKEGTQYFFPEGNRPWSAYVPQGFTLHVWHQDRSKLYRSYNKGTGGFYNMQTNDCKPCYEAYYVRVTKTGGSSNKSVMSVNGCSLDENTYKYRGLKKGKCPRGWEESGCEDKKKQCQALKKSKKETDSANTIRQECDNLAKKNKEEFKKCKGLEGGKRYGCVGKALPKCLERLSTDAHNKYKGKADGSKAIVYKDWKYGGDPWEIDVPAQEPRLNSNFNNSISSLKVPSGWKFIGYEHSKFKGDPKTFTGDQEYVGDDWNDKISSFRIIPA